MQHYYREAGLAPSSARGAAEQHTGKVAAQQLIAAGDAPEDGNMLDMNILVPLLYAPTVPLMRIVLRNRVSPERLTHLTLGAIGIALSHAGYVMFSDSSVALRR